MPTTFDRIAAGALSTFQPGSISEPVNNNVPCKSLFQTSGVAWLEPVQLAAAAIAKLAGDAKTIESVLDILTRLTDDDYLIYLRQYYREGLRKFRPFWGYADLPTFLHAASSCIEPKNYLEIGVRRGRSAAIVAAMNPHCTIYGFDMWMPDYAGMPNPGPDFVADELRRIGFQGKLELVSGDSHETLPDFLRENQRLEFELINVDGDHSEAGARKDLETVLPRLKIGGAVLLDDIVHPQHTYLEAVWDSVLGNDSNFSTAKYKDLGYGVAVAVRKR